MTLEEAIKHAEEKAKCGGKCGEDHAQLAEWLKELQKLRAVETEKRTEERTETHACDCISRQAAIDALIRKIRPHNNGDGTITMWVMSEELVRETLNEVPSAQPEPQWIPCSERLPEESGLYIVTNVGSWVEPARYCNIRTDVGFWSGHPSDKVLAWMPLPTPYKEDTE